MILYFLALGIGSIILTGYFSFYSARRALLSRTFEQLTSINYARKSAVEDFFRDRLTEAKQKASALDETSFTSEKISPVNILFPANGYYIAAFLFRSDGKLMLPDSLSESKLDVAEIQAQVNEISGKQTFIFDYSTSMSWLDSMLLVIAPVKENGNAKYFLAWEIDPAQIDRMLSEAGKDNGFGNSGETYIVGDDKLMRSQSRFIENSRMTVRVDTRPVMEAFNFGESNIISDDYRGVEVLSSSSQLNISGLNWIILSEIDYKETVGPVSSIRNSIMLLTVMAAVVFFIITYLISRKITAPIIKLKDAASDIGDGIHHGMIEISSNDEIGELTEAFNKMSIKLREKEEALRIEKYNRLRSTIDGQDIERQRLSRELHDGIGQSLIAVRLHLGALEGGKCSSEESKIKNVIGLTDGVIDEVRAISNALMPPTLTEFGLTPAIKQLCNTLNESTGMAIDFSGEIPGERLNRKSRLYIFRIVQELLNNAARHSNADRLVFNADIEDDILRIEISDNGQGFDLDSPCAKSGHGLNNIRERADLIKAMLLVESEKGHGTRITLKYPLNKHTP